MAQNIPFTVMSNDQSRIVCYRKTSPGNNKTKSGIIERHTYKTDTGQLLSNITKEIRISNQKNNTNVSHASKTSSNLDKVELTTNNLSCKSPNDFPEKCALDTRMYQKRKNNANSCKTGSFSIIRTEHCDSTTDIDTTIKKCDQTANCEKRISLYRNINRQEYEVAYPFMHLHCESSPSLLHTVNNETKEDSDSDCQIIEINYSTSSKSSEKYDETNNFSKNFCESSNNLHVSLERLKSESKLPQSKVLSWMETAGKADKYNEPVQVISDSDGDEEVEVINLQANELKNVLSCVNTINISEAKANKENIIQSSIENTDEQIYTRTDSTDIMTINKDNEIHDLESSVYVISDGIKIILPSETLLSSSSKSITSDYDQYEMSKNDTDVNISDINFQQENILQNVVIHSDPPENKIIPIKSKNENLYSLGIVNVTNLTNCKMEVSSSPESIKSEFYSYLKINTNPLVHKSENVSQNRRSTRVKNLIIQNEKLKIKSAPSKKVHGANNDVRTKFLKYRKSSLLFPTLNLEELTQIDFDETIEKYFEDEKFDYTCKGTARQKEISKGTAPKLSQNHEARILYNKIVIRHKNLKNKKYKNIYNPNTFVKNKPILRKINNRILRNRRLTRHSLKNYSNLTKKILASHNNSAKIKKQLPENTVYALKVDDTTMKHNLIIDKPEANDERSSVKITSPSKLSTSSLLESDSDIENLELKINLNCKKKDRLMTSDHDGNVSGDDIINSLVKHESIRRLCSTPQCLGFQPDDTNHKIREGIENILTSIEIHSVSHSSSEQEKKSSEDFKALKKDYTRRKTNLLLQKCDEVLLQPKGLHNEEEDKKINKADKGELCKDNNPEIVPELFNSDTIKYELNNYIPLNPNVKTKSFHRSLLYSSSKRKSVHESPNKTEPLYTVNNTFFLPDAIENTCSSSVKKTQQTPAIKKSHTHEIDIQKYNGPVFNAYYVNFTLIIVQEVSISFWKQTPLGNVLGAQNMWISIGKIKRLMLERGCINRRSSEMVLNVDNSVAYIELWTKEHQSEYRERPVADVFATVYFYRGHGPPDKKVLQLENIKGYGNDVRFAVMKNSKEIVVSWYDTYSKPAKSIIRSYQLASDFQTIASTKEMESVDHYILSLHNIENCDTLILGAGSDQLSVWNLSHGWLSSNVSFAVQPSLQIHSMCLWAQCETGYLFLLQQIGRGLLRLVAVNGVSSQWKQLQVYKVPECYESLLGVTIESGVLMTCYTNGFLCYDMQSGEVLADTETPINRIILPSDKYLVSIDDYQVSVKHVMVYVLEN